jgi:hypothetical protein
MRVEGVVAGVSVEVDSAAAVAVVVAAAVLEEVEDSSKHVFEQLPLPSNWAGGEVLNSTRTMLSAAAATTKYKLVHWKKQIMNREAGFEGDVAQVEIENTIDRDKIWRQNLNPPSYVRWLFTWRTRAAAGAALGSGTTKKK